MRVAILGDTHFGCRNDSQVFSDYFEKFYKEVFFPYIDQNNIKTVIQLGDLFDRRKYINFASLKSCVEYFFKEVEKRDLEMIYLIGNHDIYFKNTLEVNSTELIIANNYRNPTTIVSKPTELTFPDGSMMLAVPWICDDNRDEVLACMEQTKAQVVVGHFEITGFEMYQGMMCEDGEGLDMFSKFDMVLSGHFHHKSHSRNVWYLGTPYEMTWSDYEDPKGFHIFDTEKREIVEFIQNPFVMFHKLFYDDANETREQILQMDVSHLNDAYVKLIIKTKDDPSTFDMFIDKLEKAGVADLQVVEDHLYLNLEDDKDIISEAEDTLSILRKSVAMVEGCNEETRIKVENKLQSLYNDALAME